MRCRVGIVMLGLLAVAAAGPGGNAPGTSLPQEARPRDRVVYVDGGRLTLIDLATDERQDLDVPGTNPVWSPDGQRIAYIHDDAIWLIDADQLDTPPLIEPRRLAPAVQVCCFTAWDVLAWHPNGRHLAYTHEGLVHVVEVPDDPATPADPRQVTDPGTGNDGFLRWSPDGATLMFRRLSDTSQDEIGLWSMTPAFPAEFAAERIVIRDEDHDVAGPAAWLDSTSIAFAARDRSSSPEAPIDLHRLDVSTAAVSVLMPGVGDRMEQPAVSPDGGQVALRVRCGSSCPDGVVGIWVLDLADGMSAWIAGTNGLDRRPSWTADGTRIVFERVEQDSGCHCDVVGLWVADPAEADPPRAIDGLDSPRRSIVVGPIEHDNHPGRVRRLSGTTRIGTALAVSLTTHSSADTAIVARADDYADALGAAGLAGALDAPLLLSDRAALPPEVRREVSRLGAERVILLGDTSALSADVEDALRQPDEEGRSPDVERIAGSSRYATAAAVAARLESRHAFVVQGASSDPTRGWPDAVAVSALAARRGAPVLLVERDRLPDETRDAIGDLEVDEVTIVGGTSAVSAGVEQAIRDTGVTVERIAGETRDDTARLVAEQAVADGADPGRPWLAVGGNWPDSLSAGPAAAHLGGVLLLVDGEELGRSTATAAWLAEHPITSAVVVGGPDVVAPGVQVALERS